MEGMEKACDRHTICQYTSMKRQGRYICCRTLTSWSKLGALNHMWPCGWTSIQQVLRSWWAAKSAWWSNFCQTNCSHKPNAECADSTAPPFVRHRTRTSQHRNESTHGEREREWKRENYWHSIPEHLLMILWPFYVFAASFRSTSFTIIASR